MNKDKKLIEVLVTIEVSHNPDADPNKLAQAWVDDRIGKVGDVSFPWFSVSNYGDVEIKRIKVEP